METSGSREETEYSDDDSYTVSEYDEAGNGIKETSYNPDGTVWE